MDDFPRQKLCEIIGQYGPSICDDRRRLEALLNDMCGEYRREINVLMGAVKERVPEDLVNGSAQVPLPVLLVQLNRRLQDNLGLTEESAHWAIESWAMCLGVAVPAPPTPARDVAAAKVEVMTVLRNFVRPFVEQVRLSWALLFDSRVSILKKLIPIIGFAYLISPISIVVGLIPVAGMLADIAIFMLALFIFNRIAPAAAVNEHTMRIRGSYHDATVRTIDMPPIEAPRDQTADDTSDKHTPN